MFGTYYNHNQVRGFLLAFGQFFNNIQVSRVDASGVEQQRLVVPVEHGPKERWLERLRQDPNLNQGVSTIVPRMSFEVTGMNYDGSRHIQSLQNLRFTTNLQRQLARVYVGVPYTVNFELAILTKTQQDATQIVEQILPYFTPDITFKLVTKLADQVFVQDMVPLTLVGVNEADAYDGDFQHRRTVIWTLSFTMKVNVYGPAKTAGRITEVIVNLFDTLNGDILDPPEVIATEDGAEFELEDGSGHIMDESTSNTYITTTRVAEIDVKALDPNQDPAEPIQSVVTITETI